MKHIPFASLLALTLSLSALAADPTYPTSFEVTTDAFVCTDLNHCGLMKSLLVKSGKETVTVKESNELGLSGETNLVLPSGDRINVSVQVVPNDKTGEYTVSLNEVEWSGGTAKCTATQDFTHSDFADLKNGFDAILSCKDVPAIGDLSPTRIQIRAIAPSLN